MMWELFYGLSAAVLLGVAVIVWMVVLAACWAMIRGAYEGIRRGMQKPKPAPPTGNVVSWRERGH